mmetsp:Transcript_42983/g.108557  ORF Transcript_42983/g.108557 Transcript_42983/m.108557 type:complete len:98 (-) Transcript_42983:27-320(-)
MRKSILSNLNHDNNLTSMLSLHHSMCISLLHMRNPILRIRHSHLNRKRCTHTTPTLFRQPCSRMHSFITNNSIVRLLIILAFHISSNSNNNCLLCIL